MSYEENPMKAAYRCVVLAASGDGSVSDDELQQATNYTEFTEGYTRMMGGLNNIFDNIDSNWDFIFLGGRLSGKNIQKINKIVTKIWFLNYNVCSQFFI